MSEWYGAPMPTGKPIIQGGTGSLVNPWDIYTIASGAGGQILPGDTIWLTEGTYSRADNKISWNVGGTVGPGKDSPTNKLIVRNYNGSNVMNQARVNIQQINTAAAETSGLLTANGVNAVGSSTISVHKAAGVNQAVLDGHQLNITSGPAAGVYVITANNTIVQNSNTTVAIAPGLRGSTANGDSITLTLSPSGIDNIQVNSGYVWFWGLELSCVLSSRTLNTNGPSNLQTFQQVNDGIKLIHCVIHDGSGGVFQERTSGRFEVYGCLFYNHGFAQTDGGGHHIYIHHSGNASQDVALYEGNVMFNDHGIGMQMYDADGPIVGKEELIDWKRNIAFNMGALNNLASLGGNEAEGWLIGGPQRVSGINVTNNYTYWPDQYGDQTIQFGATGQRIDGINIVSGNYLYGGGSGFGKIYFPTTVSGTVTVKNNIFRVQRPDPIRNGRIINLVDSGKNMIWSNNIYYRSAGVGGNACGDETGTGIPLAFKESVGPCRTLAQFLTDTGFTGDVLFPDPVAFSDIFVVPTTKYESGRGWVLYYNYANLLSIPVDLSLLGISPGDNYIVHDVRNVWADIGITTGKAILGPSTYGGGKINFPVTQLDDPVQTGSQWGIRNEKSPPKTAPQFNVFLVRKTSSGYTSQANATLLDFGTFPGSSDASVNITGQTGILETSLVEAWVYPAATGDHTKDEHIVNPPWVVAGDIVPGVGFTIYGRAQSEVEVTDPTNANPNVTTNNTPLVYGQWTVAWAWK